MVIVVLPSSTHSIRVSLAHSGDLERQAGCRRVIRLRFEIRRDGNARERRRRDRHIPAIENQQRVFAVEIALRGFDGDGFRFIRSSET